MSDLIFDLAISAAAVTDQSAASYLRSRDTAQREALARVEADNRQLQLIVNSHANMRDTAQAQLAEAVGLLRDAMEDFRIGPTYGWEDRLARRFEKFLSRTPQAEQQEVCWQCGGTGEVDTGGVMPWGAPATATCPCQREDQAEQQEAQGPMAKMAEGLRQKAADEWASHPSNPVNQEAQGAKAGDERAAFEKWAKDRSWFDPRPSTKERDDSLFCYEEAITDHNWIAWQARAALATQPAAGEPVASAAAVRVQGDGEVQ